MCRNIKTLYNFEPPATEEDIYAASVQFVRKIGGFSRPSKVNEAAFHEAVEAVAAASRHFLGALRTSAPPKSRAEEMAKAHARAAQRWTR